ncbi:hypothetical protein [Nitrospirillum viridazoti]|uniref:Bacteriophage lambda head decoration protein D n=1 Tax=Nitrospirillum amazonense TaxID=28077 RepID=A0A560II43_9PROT|nr:hypothetical protein [Nitrospirillum amazonense]TWB58687.1 hypothetical protein FBZ92_109180 [Nitrospirillum amazonense]
MTALTADRRATQQLNHPEVRVLPVAAGAKIYGGALVVLNATGYAKPGVTGTGLLAVGRADIQVDNSLGTDGALSVPVRRGVFCFANSASADQVTNVHITRTCYVVDDQTVAATDGSSTRSAAGKVFAIDDAGVWVEFA